MTLAVLAMIYHVIDANVCGEQIICRKHAETRVRLSETFEQTYVHDPARRRQNGMF